MPIQDQNQDYWGSSSSGLISGLYYYYLDPSLFFQKGNIDNTQVLGHSNAIKSFLYMPFVYQDNLNLFRIAYDNQRLGKLSNYGELINNPVVFRIGSENTNNPLVRRLATFSSNLYTAPSLGGTRNWKNESKLNFYPYTYAEITDYINPPLKVLPQFCPYSPELWVKPTISDKCTYMLYVKDYKNDTFGQVEGMISTGSLDLPNTSDSYSNFMANNKAQFLNSNEIARNNIQRSFIQGQANNVMSGIGNALSMNVGGLMGNFTNALFSGYNMQTDINNNILMENSKLEDLKSSPRAVISMGGDVSFSKLNARNEVSLIWYGLQEFDYERIGTIFALYGYKQNKLMTPNTRSRRDYNYIKNIETNFSNSFIPKKYMDKIKQIYNNGITIWHIDRNGNKFLDYNDDNVEMKFVN